MDLSFDDLIPQRASVTVNALPRGERNNNPGNIEDGPFARSQPGYVGGDGRFAKFETPDHGAAAIDSLLASYGKRGINTPEGVIGRWAPQSDGNPTPQYAAYVAEGLGVQPNAPIDLGNPDVRRATAERIAQFENGRKQPAQNAQPNISFDDLVPQQFQTASPDLRAAREGGQSPSLADIRGQQTSPAQQIAIDYQNQQSAAGQRTTPNVAAQSKNLVSSDVFQNDAGEIMYRDPNTGQIVPTDQNKQVALRDPSDNKLKIYNRDSGTDEGRISSAGRLLMTGMGSGAPTARPAIPVMKPAAPPSAAELKSAAQAAYNSPVVKGVEIAPEAASKLADNITQTLIADGHRDYASPTVFRAINELKQVPGETAKVADFDTVRKVLNKVPPQSDQYAAAQAARAQIDEYIAGLGTKNAGDVIAGDAGQAGQMLADARGNYAAAKRSERIGTAENIADLNAASSGSGANIDNTTRQAIKGILRDPKKLRGFSADEVDQMREIVRGTFTGNTARLLGKLAPTGVVSLVGGHFVGAPLGGSLAVPAIGYVAKKMSDVLTQSNVARLDALSRSRSPLAKQIEASSTAWQKAEQELGQNPSIPKLAMFTLASRNLANNLKDVGIKLDPQEFLRAIAGSSPARPEDQQGN